MLEGGGGGRYVCAVGKQGGCSGDWPPTVFSIAAIACAGIGVARHRAEN